MRTSFGQQYIILQVLAVVLMIVYAVIFIKNHKQIRGKRWLIYPLNAINAYCLWCMLFFYFSEYDMHSFGPVIFIATFILVFVPMIARLFVQGCALDIAERKISKK